MANDVPTDFFSLLRNDRYRPIFEEWLKADHSYENYLFWKDVEEYKQLPADQMQAAAKTILGRYFELGSDYEINTDHHQKIALKERMEHPTLDMFDEIQISIFLLMRLDSYPKFLESDAFAAAQGKTLPQKLVDDPESHEIEEAPPTPPKKKGQCHIL